MPAQLSFNHIKSEDGLPQNSITALLQDHHGFVWIGTYDGLHKYDGYRFTSFKHDLNNKQSISSNKITTIIEDKDGLLWVGTDQGGLNRLDPETGLFTRFTYSANEFNSINHNRINALHIDKEQQLWVGTFKGLNLFMPETNTFAHFQNNPFDDQSIPDGSVIDISDDGNGNLYIATKNVLTLFNIDQQTFERFESFDSPTRINDIYLDEDQSLWIGTQLDGLFHFIKETREFKQFFHNNTDTTSLSSNNVQAIIRDSRGNLWIGTEQGGLNLKPRGSSDFIQFKKNSADAHSLSMNEVWSLMEDNSGQIWIGTAGAGINKTTPHFQNFSRIQHIPFDSQSLSHNIVLKMEQDDQGFIWFATLNGIDRYDPLSGEFEHFNNFHNGKGTQVGSRVTSLTVAQGHLWFGNQDGQLAKLNTQKKNTEVELISREKFLTGYFSNQRIRFITKDQQGNIWVATDEGLSVLDPKSNNTNELFSYASVGQLGISPVYTMMQDDQGIMWFGTWDSGLQRYDPEFKQTRTLEHRADDEYSLSNNTIRSIYQDNKGNLWIGTNNGLNLLRYEDRIQGNFKFTNYFESGSNGLPNNTIYAISSDDAGYLWLSTNKGLSRFDMTSNQFKNFSSLDGLPADEFNSNSVLKTKSGKLYFGSVGGVAVIDPKGIGFSKFKPPLYITDLDINGQPHFVNKNWKKLNRLSLSFNENDIVFRFSALDFRLPQRNQYSYRLLPDEKNWRTVIGKNEVQFGNLKPNHYEFQLRASNSDGYWLDDVYSFHLEIEPPLWATWWAYSLYLLALISLLGWYIFNHAKKLEEQTELNRHLQRIDKLKDEFLANTSHELRTPLNGIIGVAESLKEGIAGDLNDKARHHLSLIIDSGKRLAHQVDEILDFKKLRHHGLLLNQKAVDLRVAAKVVINLLQPLADEKQLQLTNSLPRFLPHLYADENRVRQILYNLLGNAIKYTEKGYVELTARVKDDDLEISVKDSGVGIPKDKQAIIFKPFEQLENQQLQLKSGTGLGLAVTRQLIELHGGKIWLKSRPESGSEFYLTLPIIDENFESTPLQSASNEQSLPTPTIMPDSEHRSSNEAHDLTDEAHILVVDDDALNRQVLNDFLLMRKFRVSEAVDGIEALEKIEQEHYDLIILDVMMPRMSGFEVSEKIRERFSHLELPILLLSAKNQPDDINTGLASGANDYVSKPVDRKVLLARVNTLLMLRQVYKSQKERAQLQAMEETCRRLSQYFPTPLVEKILDKKHAEHFHPERRCVTILFADLVGFTEFSDRFEPETVTDVLNEFLSTMGQKIKLHHGLLNEVLGDGLVVLFGALDHLDKATQATQAAALALEMQKEIVELSERWRATGLEQHLSLTIGIHQSYVTLGNFGSSEMVVFRAVGSGVNLAARIQGLCHAGEIRVSYPVFAQAREDFEFIEEGEVQFKGFNHNHKIYQLKQ